MRKLKINNVIRLEMGKHKRKQQNNAPNNGQATDTYVVTGYKAFHNAAVDKKAPKEFVCRGYQFKVGNEYQYLKSENDGLDIEIGLRGFHFCTQPGFIQTYYNYHEDQTILFAEVRATGRVQTDWNDASVCDTTVRGDKFVTDRIKIVKEISRADFLTLCNGTFRALDGTEIHCKNGHLQSVPEHPALKRADGYIEHRDRGRLHCEVGPAQIWEDGKVCFWYNGQRHRDDGPAVKYPSGQEEWYSEGLLHRAGGPAMTLVSGARYNFCRGKQIGCA